VLHLQIVSTAIASLFTLFSVGMAGNTIYLAMHNLTTVETLDRGRRLYHLAIRVNSKDLQTMASRKSQQSSGFEQGPWVHTISYPLQPARSSQTHSPDAATDSVASDSAMPSIPGPERPQEEKTFAILRTYPGDNPWDLGVLNNMKQILGNSYIDWLLPFQYPPIYRHERGDQEYPFGPVVDRLKQEVGISADLSNARRRTGRQRKRRQRAIDDYDGSDLNQSDRSRRRRRKRRRRRESVSVEQSANEAQHP